MIAALTQPLVPIVLLITSYRTQIQNAKLLVHKELLKTKQVTGNAQTAYQTVINALIVALVLHVLLTTSCKTMTQNAKPLVQRELMWIINHSHANSV